MTIVEIISAMLELSPDERIKLLTVTMRYIIETGEAEASSIRTTLSSIESE